MTSILSDGHFVVTGARSGIGLAVCKSILQEGGQVIAVLRSDQDKEEFSSLVAPYADRTHAFFADLSVKDEVVGLIKEIKASFKKVDGLVNCAGIVQYEMFRMYSDAKLEEMLRVNVEAPLALMRGLFPLLRKAENPSIVNISSLVSLVGVSGQLVYSATKGAVNSMTLSASKEFGPSGIRVNAVAPGIISSERLVRIMTDKFGEKEYQSSLGRFGKPEEVADCCVYLLSPRSSYITGQIIAVDGGLSL